MCSQWVLAYIGVENGNNFRLCNRERSIRTHLLEILVTTRYTSRE